MKFIHCPTCGEKLVQRNIGDEGLVPYCNSCNHPRFNIPYTCTLTLVVNELEEVALLRQNYVSKSSYVLVAGYVKSGEVQKRLPGVKLRRSLEYLPNQFSI